VTQRCSDTEKKLASFCAGAAREGGEDGECKLRKPCILMHIRASALRVEAPRTRRETLLVARRIFGPPIGPGVVHV
jgi:hypothetical protein